VEELVGARPGFEDVVVDVPERHRPANRLRCLVVGPAAPRDEQGATCVGMEVADALQEVVSRVLSSPPRREHDRHSPALRAQFLELGERGLRRRAADDAVVALVPLQLVRQACERLRVGIDRDDERALVRGGALTRARVPAPSRTPRGATPRRVP
jgi:hypothetical protein